MCPTTPIYDLNLITLTDLKSTGANIHLIRNKITAYQCQFGLVKRWPEEFKWTDKEDFSEDGTIETRAEYVESLSKEIRMRLNTIHN